MSRTQLKKELSSLTASQLVEVVLDAYSARKEIKEYFDFYINPDVERLLEKYKKVVIKEFNRTKWGTSKARVSNITKAIKEFESFQPGADHVLDFLLFVIDYAVLTEFTVNFTETQFNALEKWIKQAIAIGDNNNMIDRVIKQLSELVDPSTRHVSNRCKRFLTALMSEQS